MNYYYFLSNCKKKGIGIIRNLKVHTYVKNLLEIYRRDLTEFLCIVTICLQSLRRWFVWN